MRLAGGVIALSSSSSVEISNGTIVAGNIATSGSGGAVYAAHDIAHVVVGFRGVVHTP